MIFEHLSAYVLGAMSFFAERDATPNMRAIADAITATSIERPSFGSAQRTALVLASIAASESGGFRDDVIDCRVLGDSGRSRGTYQIWGGPKQVCTDQLFAAHTALTIAEDSMRVCGTLAAYCSGQCNRGRAIARHYQDRAEKFAREHPMMMPVPD